MTYIVYGGLTGLGLVRSAEYLRNNERAVFI